MAIPLFWSRGTMTQRCRLAMQGSAFPLSLRIRGLPLTRSPLPSPLDQGKPSSFMGQVALARHTVPLQHPLQPPVLTEEDCALCCILWDCCTSYQWWSHCSLQVQDPHPLS